MNNNFAKIFSSLAMAGVLTFTGIAAQAAEAVNAEYTDTLSIESRAANIKSIYKANYPEDADLIDCIVDSIITDDEFIRCFEANEEVAFQIVADALDESLEPKTALYSFGNEMYYSKYSSYPCKQLNNYYDGPAAVVMALMGSGCIDYTQNKSTLDSYQRDAAKAMGTDDNKKTSIYDITDYLQKKYVEKFGPNTGGSFKTKVFNKSNADLILSCIYSSLDSETEPIIEIPDRSVLYSHRNETGPLYITVEVADDQGQYIVYTDPALDKGTGKSISYDELKALAEKGNVWMSMYS